MLLAINHTTRYQYENPGSHAVQRLRLTPQDNQAQTILDWKIDAPGIEKAAIHTDALGNVVHLIAQAEPAAELTITASGRVETMETGGVYGPDKVRTNPQIFLTSTRLTESSAGIHGLAERARSDGANGGTLGLLHALMALVLDAVVYETDTTHSGTSAAEAFESGRGVCQDHSHILISAARLLEIPARYVTGYLHVTGSEQSSLAHHAWAEAFVPDLGWVGFDPANGVCPTDHYLRMACGFDAIGAAPVVGVRKGSSAETLTVDVTVNQQQQ